MRARTAAAAAALLLLACAGPRSAAERTPDRVGDAKGPPAIETNAGEVEGVVAEVDRDEGTVSIASGDTVRTVPLAAEGAVLIDDFDASFDDVEEGQAVRAALHDAGSGVEAVRIQILNQGVPVEAGTPEEPAAEVEPAPADGAAPGQAE